MTLYVGETVTVKLAATNPVTGLPISDATASVELFAPGKDPKGTPADRESPDTTAALTWDATAEAYLGYVPTDGFAAGKWSYRAILGGAYDSWEYGSFTLKP